MRPASDLGGRRWRLGLGPAMWLLLAEFVALPFVLVAAFQAFAEREADTQARALGSVIAEVRSFYTRNVVARVRDARGAVQVSERYRELPGAIPIPATLTIELGEAIHAATGGGAYAIGFVSDLPFRYRSRPPLDAFEEEALHFFRRAAASSDGPTSDRFTRVEHPADGPATLRVAAPLRMEPGCVACHNSHPDSPARDWKVGDVRGIQVVSVRLDYAGHLLDVWWLGAFLVLFAGTAALAFGEHRGAVRQLSRLNDEIEESRRALLEKGERLEASVRDLGTKTTVLDRAPFGVLVLDPAAREAPIVYANEAFCRATGYSAREVLGRHPRFLFGPDTGDDAAGAIEAALRAHTILDRQAVVHRRDATPRTMRWLVFPCFGESGELLSMVATINDVTELVAAEEERGRLLGELQESMKLESLGLTIAGIAHDLNTPIGIAVTGSTHVAQCASTMQAALERDPPDVDLARQFAARARRGAELVASNLGKAAHLVRGFKETTADATRREWRRVGLRSLLESLLVSLSPLMKRARCEVALDCPGGLGLRTDPGALTQAVTNLAINATLHAFEGREDRRLAITARPVEGGVEIRIADNGNGMTEEAALKAFTPFFTTRRTSGGSGLGLFSSRRAVSQLLGGQMTFTTRAGEGTEFVIHLPDADRPNGNSTDGAPKS